MNNVNLQVEPHEHLAITGPSGSGKTTLLNLMSGIDIPTSGSVEVCGQVISSFSEEKRVEFRDANIAMVFQDFCLFPGLTAFENVKMLKPKRVNSDECFKVLDEVGLSHRAHTRAQYLSGGEMQRVAIARALIKKPRIIFADEPTAQLDKHTSQNVMDVFFTLRELYEITLVLVTHDSSVANRCDRVVTMESLGK